LKAEGSDIEVAEVLLLLRRNQDEEAEVVRMKRGLGRMFSIRLELTAETK
jgi:hypothetical protein